MHIVVLGATGAIGGALVKKYKEEGLRVTALSRRPDEVEADDSYYIDLADEKSIETAFKQVSDVDIFIMATGVLHKGALQPEKSLKQLKAIHMQEVFYLNTIAPALVMRHMQPKLTENGKMAFLSAKVGSISDNYLGGWYSYRASKAALNMLVKTTAIELKRSAPLQVIAALHPGTVDSSLSKPFQSFIQHEVFEPMKAAGYLKEVLHHLTPEDSGKLFAYDGTEIQP